MTDSKHGDVLRQLDRLLDEEHAALLVGQIDAVAAHSDMKEVLINRLNSVDLDELPDLAPLHTKLGRNQILLDGALSGIQRVASRLAAYRRIRQSLETYDAQGKRQSIATEIQGKVEKRA